MCRRRTSARNKKIDETQVDLQAVKTTDGTWTGSLKDDITDAKKDFHEAIANTRNNLQDELGLMIQGKTQMTKILTDTTQRRLTAKVAEVEARIERGKGTGSGASAAKPPDFNGTTSWIVFRLHFETRAEHNCWTRQEKSAYLITTLQGRATDVLHENPEKVDL
jgi:hypothetical protein